VPPGAPRLWRPGPLILQCESHLGSKLKPQTQVDWWKAIGSERALAADGAT